MRRSVTEKGIQAERWHLHLGFINGLRGDELFRYARDHARHADSGFFAPPKSRGNFRLPLLTLGCFLSRCHLQISKQKMPQLRRKIGFFVHDLIVEHIGSCRKRWFTVGQSVYHNVNEGPLYINLRENPPLSVSQSGGGF